MEPHLIFLDCRDEVLIKRYSETRRRHPLALRGVAYKPIGASALLRRNLFIYGLGGIVVPFIGIKLIDLLLGLFL